MFLKDETYNPAQKNIKMAFAKQPAGPWSDPTQPITKTTDYWAEGPTSIQIGSYWYLYFDKYRKHRYGCLRTKDFETWEDVSGQLEYPNGMRHGTAFEAPKPVIQKLKELKP
jgi:hypothetical protein